MNHKKWTLKLLVIDSGYADFIQEKYYADAITGDFLDFSIYIIGYGFLFDTDIFSF